MPILSRPTGHTLRECPRIIIQLSPQRAGSGNVITSWVAISDGGRAVTSPYYALPERIDAVRTYESSRTDSEIACEAPSPALEALKTPVSLRSRNHLVTQTRRIRRLIGIVLSGYTRAAQADDM
jgi:hypothetical protein